MKTLKEVIKESKKTITINSDIKYVCDLLMKGIDYSKFIYLSDDTFNKSNEQLVIDNFKHTLYKAISTEEYYNTLFNNPEYWNKLRKEDRIKIDITYGDIIIVDKNNNKPIYFIDLKVAPYSSYVGSISIGSLSEFTENGIYLCVSKNSKKYLVVSHKDLADLVENDPSLISEKSEKNSRIGKTINFANERRNSEDYIGGKTLEELF